MENLFATSRELVSRVDTSYVRDKHQEIKRTVRFGNS